MYTPDEFGILTLFVTLTGLLSAASTGKYDDAVMLPKRDKEAVNLFVLALLLSGTVAFVVTGILPWKEQVASMAQSPELSAVLFLLPATVLFSCWSNAQETWHTRYDRFRLVSIGRIAQHTGVVAVKIGAGLLGFGAIGLVGGATFGVVVFAVVLGVALLLKDRYRFRATISLARLRVVARRYKRFPFFSVPAAVLNLGSTHLPVILLAAFFGAETVGFFGLALGSLLIPINLFTKAVGQVFFVRAPDALRKNELGILSQQVSRRLIAIALFPMLVIVVSGPDLFAFVFGEPWREAGHYGQFMALWLFAASTASPLTYLFDITQNQRSDLLFGVILFGTQAVVLYLFRNAADPIVAIGAMSVAGFASRCTQIGWLLHIGQASWWLAIRDLLMHAAFATLVLVPAVLAILYSESLLLLFATLAFASATYAAFIIRTDWRSPRKG